MKRRIFLPFGITLLILSMILSACAPAATEVPAVPTEVPAVPTEVPAVPTEVATLEPWTAKYNLSAPDCAYGGEFKSIEAVDQYTAMNR